MKTLITLVISLFAFAMYAQTENLTHKVGFADVDYIIMQMPETKQIETELQNLQSQLKQQMDSRVKAFQDKLTEYRQFGTTVPDAVRVNTERELEQMQANIEQLQQDSRANLQKKQGELMEPVYSRVANAINEVAKKEGYTLIINGKIGNLDVVLYGDERIDVSDLVLKEMGITPQASITPEPDGDN